MNDLMKNFCTLAKYALIAFIVYVLADYTKDIVGRDFNKFTRLIEIIAWPTVVVGIIFSLRRVLTYLVLSLEEYHFFGAKGKLRKAEDIIEERAQQKCDARMAEQEAEEKNKKDQKRIESLENSKKTKENQIKDLLKLAEDFSAENKALRKEKATIEAVTKEKTEDEMIKHIVENYDLKKRKKEND